MLVNNMFCQMKNMVLACVLALACTYMTAGCAEKKQTDKSAAEQAQTQSLRMSISEVEALINKQNAEDGADFYEDETTLFYQKNNELALDRNKPWNGGSEPLYTFVEKFRADAKYRKERLALEEGFYDPTLISDYAFVISETDSTGFFSAWSHVDTDSASFCTGWMNSEVLEEFAVTRKDSTQNWMLVNYYHAI